MATTIWLATARCRRPGVTCWNVSSIAARRGWEDTGAFASSVDTSNRHTTRVATATAPSARQANGPTGLPLGRKTSCRWSIFTSCLPCQIFWPTWRCRTHRSSRASCSARPPRRFKRWRRTRVTWVYGLGCWQSCTPGVKTCCTIPMSIVSFPAEGSRLTDRVGSPARLAFSCRWKC